MLLVPIRTLNADNHWRPLCWRSRALRVDDLVMLDFRPETPPGVEAAMPIWGPPYGLTEAFLGAPFPGPLQ